MIQLFHAIPPKKDPEMKLMIPPGHLVFPSLSHGACRESLIPPPPDAGGNPRRWAAPTWMTRCPRWLMWKSRGRWRGIVPMVDGMSQEAKLIIRPLG